MSVTVQLEAKIQERRETIARLEHEADQATKALHGIERKIQDAQVEVRAFEEVLRLVQGEERKSALGSAPDRTVSLRPGTKIAKVRDVIREASKPLHIDVIMDKLGEPRDHNARVSLVGSLSKYVKSGQIFTRTAPNTFWLKGVEPKNKSEQLQDVIHAIDARDQKMGMGGAR